MATTTKPAVKGKPTTKSKSTAKAVNKPAKSLAAKPTSKSVTPSTEFNLYAPEAGEVLLAGDFCNWQGETCRMRRVKDGNWKKSLNLKPGRYEYRFVVDGHWWTDPENPARQQNPYGQDNSVLVVT